MRYLISFSRLTRLESAQAASIVQAKRYAFTQIRELGKNGYGPNFWWCYLRDFDEHRQCTLWVSKDGKAHQSRWGPILF